MLRKKELARLTGTKESEIDTNDMKSQLDQRAKVEASKMMRKCQTSRIGKQNGDGDDCKSKYKAEYAARTGRSAGEVDDTMIKEGEAKRKQEEAANALKTIAETKHKCRLAGAKSLAECMKEERDAKKTRNDPRQWKRCRRCRYSSYGTTCSRRRNA